MLLDVLSLQKSFVIYGAQVVAYGAYMAIKKLTGRLPECFVVSDMQGNPPMIEGVPVCLIDSVSPHSFVVVGVTELVQKDVIPFLSQHGFKNIFALTQHEEYLLMSIYFASIRKFPVAETRGNEPVDFTMYEVCNHRDTPLARHPRLLPFERAIQAGAALTIERIVPLLDTTGDNISAKNKQYCEMTATYWIWKNTSHNWKGIEHYRRHLLVSPAMLADDVDAILPLPYICYPDTVAQFRRFVGEDVLQALLDALQELHPKEYSEYLSVLHGPYQYTYNLVCARRDVFDDYCAWFFRITEYMENLAGHVPALAETRALSYVAEVLTNLYFMSHQDRLRISHVEKAIYV